MKQGLGDSYDNTTVLPVKARAYLDLTKPASTLGVMGAYAIGSLFYFYFIGSPGLIGDRFLDIIYTVLTLGLAHGAAQAMNMAEDAEMDRDTEHKKNRPIPSGVVTEEEGRTIAWFLMIFALGRAYTVNASFGSMIAVLIIFGVFYNLNPIRAKERIISIPWQAVSRGLLSFPVIWAAYGDLWDPVPWALGGFMFFYVLGFQNTADIIDIDVDSKYGIKTFAVVYGVDGVAKIAGGCMFLMIAWINLMVSLSVLPIRFMWILSIIPFCLIMLYYMTYHPEMVSERTGNHPSWQWFYIGMVLTVALPLLVEMIA